MSELWATEDLPATAWHNEPPDEDDDPDLPRDLWGQGITAHETRTMTTITPAGRYL